MAKFFSFLALSFLCGGSVALAAQSRPPDSQSWSGVIINGSCSADDAFAEAAKCTEAAPGTTLALYDDTIRQVYTLDPQGKAAGYLGSSVTVRGALDGVAIHVTSIQPLTSFGLDVGDRAPIFSAPDQFGKAQTLDTLRGPKGTVLLFVRSADWCPYCKGQLIQLQAAKARFEKQGIKLASVSYDSQAILKFFADRRKIEFPMLADPDSKIIQQYQVLNAEAVGQNKGMARPGYFFIDTHGIIREKFFESKYRERLTGNDVLSKLFPELGEEVADAVEAPHIRLRTGQSDQTATPGNLVTLSAEIDLPQDVHVYAPGNEGYKPVKLTIDPTSDINLRAAAYPNSKILYLPVVGEKVSVYEGTFQITQELKVNSTGEFSSSLGTDGRDIAINGKLDYQACDKQICYLPTSVPLHWQLHLMPLDRVRAPEVIRHK